MGNYFNITYDTGYLTPLAIQLNNYDGDQIVDGLDVDISLSGPAGWTPTHYKLWNIDGVTTSGAASWQAFQAEVSGTLIDQSGKQHVYCQFKDASHVSDVVTSSGVTFSWASPTIDSSVSWTDSWASLNYGSAESATLRNTTYNTDITLSRSNIPDLRFSGKDFSDIKVFENSIEGSSSSQIGSLLAAEASTKLGISKTFADDTTPLVWVDADGDGTRVTLTQYDGAEKSGLAGDYTGRVENYSWNSGTKTATFDITQFSQYGFSTVDKVEFTSDSMTGGYNGYSINVKVSVMDTVGEYVENAPVTISGISGDNIGSFSSNIVNTDSSGVATFTLNLSSVGIAVYDAYCDSVHTSDDQTTWCIDAAANSGRSLLRQEEQIRWSDTYDDAVASVNTSSVAEPTVTSGSENRLEHDMNVIRTLHRQIKGTTNWYDSLETYFDPTSTDSGNAENKDMTLSNIKGNTLDSQTMLLAVTDDNSGAGFTTASGNVGFLANITIRYATDANRKGLPIFSSTAGTYHDEGGPDNVCVVDLIDTSTGSEFVDNSGNIIYAKFHDAADHSGTGTGTDVYVKFYANNSAYTFDGDDPTNISIIYPYRKIMKDVEEWEWCRTDFVSSFEGDDELVEDISNLWSFTGAVNDDVDPTWTNTSANYPLSGNPSDLEAAINTLNDVIDDMTFTEDNYIADDDTVADALNKLDMSLKDVSNLVTAGVADVYIEELSSDVLAEIIHPLPIGVIYTPDTDDEHPGSNMDVFLDGQLLAADSVSTERDYEETTTSGITFHMNIYQDSNVTYKVRE